MSALAAQLANYLKARQHTLSTAHLDGIEKIKAEASYVFGEAAELRGAVQDLATFDEWGTEPPPALLDHVRHELADVVLAATTLAGFLGTTVEECIAEKTEKDRGRG